MKVTNRKTIVIIGLCLLLIGVGLIVWSGFSFSSYIQKKRNYVKTYAIVVDFEANIGFYNGYFEEDRTYAPIIEYHVNGKIYTKQIDEYSSPPKYYEGDVILIRYNPKDPNQFILEFDFSFIWISIIGLVFGGCGVLAIAKGGKQK